MTERREAAPAPGLLETFAQVFDPLFAKLNQRESFRRYLAGLLLPTERNKTLIGLANTAPGVGPWRRGRRACSGSCRRPIGTKRLSMRGAVNC